LTDKNTRLHYLEGEKNAELAALRGDTTKQLTYNQELEAEIERLKHINQRIAQESEDIQLQKARIERQAQDHRQRAAGL
jgi:predicted  nucleic acid-binding Zn-ribbon protein